MARGGGHDIPEPPRGIFDRTFDDESIEYLDDSEAEVGFPTGAMNKITVVEVSSEEAQHWMEELELEPGARIWTPESRFYLFDYVEPSVLRSVKSPVPGLRFLNDGDWIPYPGNLMDGHLVHWEHDPWAVGTYPLPKEFWDQRCNNPA